MDVFDLEKKFPGLENVKFNGIHAWPILRIVVGYELAKKNFKPDRVGQNPKLKKTSNFIKSFYGWARCLLRFRKIKYIIFTNNLEKRIHNGLYYDRLFHSTTRLLEEKEVLVVNYCEGNVEPLKKTYYKNVINGDFFNYASILFRRFQKLKINHEDKSLIEEVIKEAAVKIDYESHLKGFLVSIALYKSFFRLTKPRLILSSCYIYFPQIFAAKNAGIKTIEYQHGLINGQHRGYRTLLRYDREFTSDRLFSFGEKSASELDESIFKKEQIRVVGYSYFELIKQGFYDPNNIIGTSKFVTRICVPVDMIVEKETIAFIVAAAPHLSNVLFILNPRVSLSAEGSKRIKDHENIVSIEGPFQVLIQQCNYNLTIFSTCAYEALYFGVPNLLYDFKGYARKIFGNTLSEQNSFYFTTEQELVDFLDLSKQNDKKTISQEGALFYSENHSERIKKEIDSLVSK